MHFKKEASQEGRGVRPFALALIGQQPHLLGLLLEHATQKGTFLIPAVPLTIVIRPGARVGAPLLLEHLT